MGSSENAPQVGLMPSIYSVGPSTPRGFCAHQEDAPIWIRYVRSHTGMCPVEFDDLIRLFEAGLRISPGGTRRQALWVMLDDRGY
jgi:hypothetical protein